MKAQVEAVREYLSVSFPDADILHERHQNQSMDTFCVIDGVALNLNLSHDLLSNRDTAYLVTRLRSWNLADLMKASAPHTLLVGVDGPVLLD